MRVTKIVTLVIIFSVFIAGCATNNTPNNNDGDNTRIYDIVWWNLFDDETIIQPIIDKYKETHQNVNIKYVQKKEGLEDGTLIQTYRDELDKNLADNEPLNTPDIVTVGNSWLGRYSLYLSPAPSTTLSADTIKNDFFPVVTQDFVRNNSVFAVPLYMDSIVIVANTKLMSTLSAADSSGPVNNWFDFLNQAKRVSKKTGNNFDVYGFAAGAENVQFLPEVLSTMFLQQKINMSTTDTVSGFSNKAIFNDNPESQNLLNFYKKFTTTDQTWSPGTNNEIALFLENKLSMVALPLWRINDIEQIKAQYGLDITYDVFPLPQINSTDAAQFIYPATYWGQAVTADSQRRGQSSVAWDFLNFVIQETQLKLFYDQAIKLPNRSRGMIFPRLALAQEQKNDKVLKTFVESLEKAKTWDMVDGFMVGDLMKLEFKETPNSQNLQSKINNNVIEKRTNLIPKPT